MKRKLVLALAIVLSLGNTAYAGEKYQMQVEGKTVNFTAEGGLPFVDQAGRLQVPFRTALESIGAEVKWSDNMAIGLKNGVEVKVPLGQKYIWVNGEKTSIDTAACSKAGITYLPIRAVMEAFDYQVSMKGNMLYLDVASSGQLSIWIEGKKVVFNEKTGYPFYSEDKKELQVPAAPVMRALNIGEITVDSHRVAALSCDLQVYPWRPVFMGDKSFRPAGKATEVEGIIYAPLEAFAYALGYRVEVKSAGAELKKVQSKNMEILKYCLPGGLGEAQLTVKEVDALVGKDLDEVAAKINTVPDALQFLISSKFQGATTGDIHFKYNGAEWSINRSAQTVYKQNEGNCGGTSNLIRYLLDGDYDELGYVAWHGDSWEGGHIFNYFKQDGQYYIVDFVQFDLGEYDNVPEIFVTDDLRNYGDYCRKINNRKDCTLKIIYAYSAKEQLPVGVINGLARKVPESYKGKITIIYEAVEEGKVIEYTSAPSISQYPNAYRGM